MTYKPGYQAAQEWLFMLRVPREFTQDQIEGEYMGHPALVIPG